VVGTGRQSAKDRVLRELGPLYMEGKPHGYRGRQRKYLPRRKYEDRWPWICRKIPNRRGIWIRVKPPKKVIDKYGWTSVVRFCYRILLVEAARRRKPDERWVYKIRSLYRKEGLHEMDIMRSE